MSKLFKTLLQHKKTLVLIIGLGLFLSLIPLHFIQAQEEGGGWGGLVASILTLPLRIAALILVLILAGIGVVTGLVCWVALDFLGWVKMVCLNVLIIHSQVADLGWHFTRDFANMFFILILVFIGLATILRLQEYQAKKTLPLLIIIALLINFSSVLVGFIVDISNIVTNFFLSHSGGDYSSLKDILSNAWTNILKPAFQGFIEIGDFMESLTLMMTAMMFGITFIIFYGFATVVYFFVVILLITRIVFLWILTILAPLAFLSYIFPATKKLYLIGWDSWWEELVKWSIIGIPIGFFLYLSNYIMMNQGVVNTPLDTGSLGTTMTETTTGFSLGEVITIEFSDLLSNMLAPFVAIVLLYLGVKFAKKLAPEMAIKIVDGVKKGVKIIAGTALAAVTLGAGAGFLAGGLSRMAAGAAKAETALGKRGITKPLQWAVGKPAKWATKGVARVTVPTLRGYEARAKEAKISSDFDKIDNADKQADIAMSQITKEGRVQHFYHMREKGTLSKITEQKWKEIEDTIGSDLKGLAGSAYKKEVDGLMKSLPDKVTAKMMLDFETDPNEKAKLTQKINDMKNTLGITDDDAAAKIIITSKIKSEDVPKIANKKFWQNKDVMYGIQRYWGGGKLRKGAEQFEGEFIEDYMKPIERKLKHYKTLPPRQAEKAYKAYIYVNPARARYLETTAAQELGFGSVWAYAPDIVRRRYGSLRKLMAER